MAVAIYRIIVFYDKTCKFRKKNRVNFIVGKKTPIVFLLKPPIKMKIKFIATIIHNTANLEDGEDFLDHTVSYAHKNLPLGGGTNTALCVTPINLDQPGCSRLLTS